MVGGDYYETKSILIYSMCASNIMLSKDLAENILRNCEKDPLLNKSFSGRLNVIRKIIPVIMLTLTFRLGTQALAIHHIFVIYHPADPCDWYILVFGKDVFLVFKLFAMNLKVCFLINWGDPGWFPCFPIFPSVVQFRSLVKKHFYCIDVPQCPFKKDLCYKSFSSWWTLLIHL